MELVRQPVPHRHAGIGRQLLHQLLAEAPVLDAVVHPAQHPGGVGNGLLLAHLGAAGVQIGHPQAQIVSRHLKGAAGAGGGLFKEEDNVLVLQIAVGYAAALEPLEVLGELQQIADFGGGVVQQLEEAPSSDIDRHVLPFFLSFSSSFSQKKKKQKEF